MSGFFEGLAYRLTWRRVGPVERFCHERPRVAMLLVAAFFVLSNIVVGGFD